MGGTVVVVGADDGTAVVNGCNGAVDVTAVVASALVYVLLDVGALVDAVLLVCCTGTGVVKSRRSMGGVKEVEFDCVELLLVLVASSHTAERVDVALVVVVAFNFERMDWIPCITLAVLRSVWSRRWLMLVTLACKSLIASTRLVRSSIRVIRCAC